MRASLHFLLIVGCSLTSIPLSAMPIQDTSPAKVSGDINAALTAARADNKDKRFAGAEALMLPITASQPELILPWIELGTAQIGLKKYADAEKSFKIALGIDPESLKKLHSDDFYAPEGANSIAPNATRASRNTAGGTVSNAGARTPQIKGVSYASLGEIYIKTGKTDEAEKAFDEAVEANPADAPLYRGNETIYFFQTGNADGQLLAAEKAIAVDPNRAMLYYFKGQALVGKSTIDPKTQKMQLPPGCAEAYRKYLALEPKGQFSADAKGVLAAAGLPLK
ncbi:MAG TPA: tetratricopeptide repeat protein [Terracidiphilus sp.]|jgi:tetratricopeptide (TPR) repeat protein|nr:tetratricopeptide repeat protein [Terracidiphilus sp.]